MRLLESVNKLEYTESHRRTIAKVITLRILFTIIHVLTAYIATGSWEQGFQIAVIATVINSFIYWTFERIWNIPQWKRFGSDKLVWGEAHLRTIVKSATWRVVITASNILIPFFVTGSWGKAILYAGISTIVNIVFFYLHERAWVTVQWGKLIRNND